MKTPSNAMACRALFLQAAGEGRGPILFGEDGERACERVLPFLEGTSFPALYLEFPLKGAPFLDVTVLYGGIPEGLRFTHPAAAGTERMLDWYAGVQKKYIDVCFGFELEMKKPSGSAASVHFQSHSDTELAGPFCEALGDPEAGRRYMEKASRMPEYWQLAYFGLFRGRPGAPLRICGYIPIEEQKRCAEDPAHLAAVFGQIGFVAFDQKMLSQISELLSVVHGIVDFQFDLLPDGTLGETFSFDICFRMQKTEDVLTCFREGHAARLMTLLESWGIADSRWKEAVGMTFTRVIPVEDERGNKACFAMVLTPNWVKIRWRNGVLQPSKMYCEGKARTL
ncbi:MAG: hypothetical protein IJG40_12535 [Oscillospiraceae bacterium]|nr:hypothetical protein [Oscillospiraceae bacterium]